MKNLLFLLVLFSASSIAQEGINYQGVATNTSGAELINQNISIQTSIISDSATGTVQWQETHSTTTDQFGLFNIVIGQGNNTGSGQSSSFEEIQWGSSNHYLKIEMDATGGSNYLLISTSQMMSVPYALHAKSANINYDSIANFLINDSTFMSNSSRSNVSIKCVDMGVSVICGGLGLDPNASLSPSNYYNYPIRYENTLNSNNFITYPHWRKFEVLGLPNDYIVGSDLMFIYNSYSNHYGGSNDQIKFLTPEVVNGRVFFYMYAVYGATGSCNSQANIGLSIPLNHAWNVNYYSGPTGGGGFTSYSSSTFRLFYAVDGSYKNSGIYFDK